MKPAIRTHIKYEAERDQRFPAEIKGVPGCEDIDKCFQCGTCSGACPLSIYMDYTPRRIIELTRSGFKDDVLQSFTIWLCSSCYACTVECPKQIKITNIMYALKQRALQGRVYPGKFPLPVLAREFIRMVRKKGRITETRLVMKLFLQTGWWKILSMHRLGLHLMRTGRLSLKTEAMEHPAQLVRLLDSFKKEAAE